MSLEAMGALLLALVAVFALGRLWFCLVEAALERIRRLLLRRREPPPWHPLPPEEPEDGEDP